MSDADATEMSAVEAHQHRHGLQGFHSDVVAAAAQVLRLQLAFLLKLFGAYLAGRWVSTSITLLRKKGRRPKFGIIGKKGLSLLETILGAPDKTDDG
jgi:hypothetical protein